MTEENSTTEPHLATKRMSGSTLGPAAVHIITWAGLMAAGAQLDIPVPGSPVPVSLQTLPVVTAGMVMGPGRGVLAVVLYWGLGAAGLPVFSGGGSGLSTLLGPTGGYLFGFAAGAALAGWLVRSEQSRLGHGVIAGVLGQLLVLALGVPWLAVAADMSWTAALDAGCWPFLPGMGIKALGAALLWHGLTRRHVQR